MGYHAGVFACVQGKLCDNVCLIRNCTIPIRVHNVLLSKLGKKTNFRVSPMRYHNIPFTAGQSQLLCVNYHGACLKMRLKFSYYFSINQLVSYIEMSFKYE